MSFQYVPTQLRSPTIPNWNPQKGFWRGIGADSGLLAFNTDNGNLGYYVITQNLWTYRLKIDNAVYSPVFNDVNGYIYWKYSSSFFYYSKAYGWILHNRFLTAGFSTTVFRDMNRRKTTIQKVRNMRVTLFTQALFPLPWMEDTATFNHAGRIGMVVERIKQLILIFLAGRVSHVVSSVCMNPKAEHPEINISVSLGGGTAVPIITSALWKRRTDASPTEEFGMRTGNGFWES